jgi:hypothetical protein
MASQQSNWAEFGKDSADRFASDVERWVMAAHAIVPIRFVIGPCVAADGDPWDDWTREHFADVVVAFVEEFARRNARMPEDAKPGGKGEIGEVTRDTVACLLQELEPDRGLSISPDIAERAQQLRDAFPV